MGRIADYQALGNAMRLFFYGTLVLVVHVRLAYDFDLVNDVIGGGLIVAAVLKLFRAIPDARERVGVLLPLAAFVVVGTAISQVYLFNPLIVVTLVVEVIGAFLLARFLHGVFADVGRSATAADWEHTANRLLWFGVIPYVATTAASFGNGLGGWLESGLGLLVGIVVLVGGAYAGFLLLRSLWQTSALQSPLRTETL